MVVAKRQEFLEDIEVEDAHEFMHPEQSKWSRIAALVNDSGKHQGGHVQKDGLVCKYKWQTLLAGCKKVADSHKGTRLIGNEYFELRSKERKERRLPAQFFEEVYTQMQDWLQYKPTMQPLHSRDLLNPEDGNFSMLEEDSEMGLHDDEPSCRAYRENRYETSSQNISTDSKLGWG